MNEIFNQVNLIELVSVVWSAVLLPVLSYIGKQIYQYLKTKKLDKYAKILYDEVMNAVKCVYETEVKDIKSTDAWTDEKKKEVKELAKQKALYALSNSVYKALIAANDDFEEYLDGMIGTVLYDVKHMYKE